MSLVRQTVAEVSVHTESSIIAKLTAHLSDTERKSFLKILLRNPETEELLIVALLSWKADVMKMRIQVETLVEKIRVKQCAIDACKDFCIQHNDEDKRKNEQYITGMQKVIDQNIADRNRLMRQLNDLPSMFDKTMQCLQDMQLEETQDKKSIQCSRPQPN